MCNKQFRDMDLAKYHADKSGHEDFSESAEAIKPLSPEERESVWLNCVKKQHCADLRKRQSMQKTNARMK